MKKMVFWHGLAVYAGLLLWLCTGSAGEAVLSFEEAWIRPLPPGMKMTAGFGLLRNTGAQTIELTAFASPDFGDVSLHRTEILDGMSRMREVPSLSIAPGETVELAPGGYHLMLMMPTVAPSAEQTISVLMTASDGRVFRFEVPMDRR